MYYKKSIRQKMRSYCELKTTQKSRNSSFQMSMIQSAPDVPKKYILCTNNHIKACSSNKKYPFTTQTRPTQIVSIIFLIDRKK